jgi:tetratricopeptide (TPR) repeat protein
MARLSHPNVIAVHDVGLHAGQVFVAMEFVEGETLSKWMRAEPRDWHQVVSVFMEAGRGLVAAHEAGLIHRDFKPDNVMIDHEGRARVLDFGLARRGPDGGEDSADADDGGDGSSPDFLDSDGEGSNTAVETHDSSPASDDLALRAQLTRTGALVGTPAYMAPEQHLGRGADSRSDQFSFCVAFYEALYGARPFAGGTIGLVARAALEGRVREPPRSRRAPKWLHSLILKGLAAKPERRWPSMGALLIALSRERERRRRKGAALGAAIVLTAVASYFAAGGDAPSDDTVCGEMGEGLVGVWDDARRGEVRRALADTGVGFAQSTSSRVEAGLDAYTARWVAQRRENCEATRLRGEQSEALMDLRMVCLDRRLAEVDSLVQVLAASDSESMAHAAGSVAELPRLEVCADGASLLEREPLPSDPDRAKRAIHLEKSLARIRALNSTGKTKAANELLAAEMPQIEGLSHPPVLAEGLVLQAGLRSALGRYADAVEPAERAYFLSLRDGNHQLAARAARQLLGSLGHGEGKHERAMAWSRHAMALARLTGDESAEAVTLGLTSERLRDQGEFERALELQLRGLELFGEAAETPHPMYTAALNNLGVLNKELGNYDESRRLYLKALETRRVHLGEDHPALASVLINLAQLEYQRGDEEAAARHSNEAVELLEAAFGPEHPKLAYALTNLGIMARRQGKLELARTHHERALGIREATFGPDHPLVATCLNNLGNLHQQEGRREAARIAHERALEIRRSALGEDHPKVASSLSNLANVLEDEGELGRARGHLDEALRIQRSKLGDEHPKVAASLYNLGVVARKLGDLATAEAAHREAVTIREASFGSDHPLVARALMGLGDDLIAMRRAHEAIAPLERALAIQGQGKGDPTRLADTRSSLARALWETPPDRGGDRVRALELAEQAHTAYTAVGPRGADKAARIADWIHGRRRRG